MKQIFFFASILTLVLASGCGTKPEAQVDTPAVSTPTNSTALPQPISTVNNQAVTPDFLILTPKIE